MNFRTRIESLGFLDWDCALDHLLENPNFPFRSETLVELHVPDFQKAYDFYKLFGFELAWMEDRYMVLRTADQALCFYGGDEAIYNHDHFGTFPRATPRGFGVEIILFLAELGDLFDRVQSQVKVSSPLQTRPWGVRDFRVEDPFGYYLRISERYDTVLDNAKASRTVEFVRSKNFKV